MPTVNNSYDHSYYYYREEGARCLEIQSYEIEARFQTIKKDCDRRNGAQGRVPSKIPYKANYPII